MKVFLITPYKVDKDFESKKAIIREVFETHGFELLLSEDIETKESLSVEKTIELFTKSDYFIADVSYERPSCYYEIGFLQALKKRIFILAKEGELVHQLLDRQNVIYFKSLKEYKNIIIEIAKKINKK